MATTTSPIKKENIRFPFDNFPLEEAMERINTHSPNLINRSIKINNIVHLIKDFYLTPVNFKHKQLYDIKIDLQPQTSSPVSLDSLLMHLKISEQ